ncbi:catecholate siderophore receptor Fiu [Chitinimonas sp.]|uniref:catecholate siderophore receptor Fiu n=1 Tax=Chitinimonas sp. TaxID=1934313 RepID=UPI0035B025DD
MAFITGKKHSRNNTPAYPLLLSAMVLSMPAAMAAEAPAALPTVKVQGDAEAPAYLADKVSSPKFVQPLVNTTQTITVIKEALIREQGATTLTEALRNSPGVSTFMLGENGSTNTGDSVYMRGFDSSSSIFVDGVRDLGAISRDTFNIEQVEVVKGPSGSDNGRGSPTGYINLVSKTAKLDDALSASLMLGTDRQRRVSADWNTRLPAMDSAAFRLNLVKQDSGVPGREQVHNDRWAIAPSLAFGLGGPSRVYLSYLHVKQDNVPEGGVPTVGLPGYTSPDPARSFISAAPRVDSQRLYGLASDYDQVDADMLTARFELDLARGVTVRNTSRFGQTDQQYLITGFSVTAANLTTPQPANPAGWQLARTLRQTKDQRNQILANQTNITADVKTGTIKHQLSAGIELIHEKQRSYGYDGLGTVAATSLYAPDANAALSGYRPVRNGVYSQGVTNTQAAYLFDTLTLSEAWLLNAGLRLDHYQTDLAGVAKSTLSSHPGLPVNTLVPLALSASDNLKSWKLGAVFKPAANGSVYVDLATSLQPPGGANLTLSTALNSAANPIYQPQKAQTYELGSKWELLDKRLSLNAALYRTNISNEVEQDPTDATRYYQTGKKRVQGLELAVSGALSRDWSINAGYALTDTKLLSGKPVGADAGSSGLNYTPRHAFTTWTTYQPLPGLTVGGGARYVGKLQRGSDGAIGTPKYTDGYWVADAMAAYEVSKHATVQLNIYNLADKSYVAAINKSGYRYQPGAPRSAQLTANLYY